MVTAIQVGGRVVQPAVGIGGSQPPPRVRVGLFVAEKRLVGEFLRPLERGQRNKAIDAAEIGMALSNNVG